MMNNIIIATAIFFFMMIMFCICHDSPSSIESFDGSLRQVIVGPNHTKTIIHASSPAMINYHHDSRKKTKTHTINSMIVVLFAILLIFLFVFVFSLSNFKKRK